MKMQPMVEINGRPGQRMFATRAFVELFNDHPDTDLADTLTAEIEEGDG